MFLSFIRCLSCTLISICLTRVFNNPLMPIPCTTPPSWSTFFFFFFFFVHNIGWCTSLPFDYMYANLFAFCESHIIMSYESAFMPFIFPITFIIYYLLFVLPFFVNNYVTRGCYQFSRPTFLMASSSLIVLFNFSVYYFVIYCLRWGKIIKYEIWKCDWGGALTLERGMGMCRGHDPLFPGQSPLPSQPIYPQWAARMTPVFNF